MIMSQLQTSVRRASKIKLENIKTLEDAYSLATDLENTETNAIFEFILTHFSPKEVDNAQSFLRVQLNNHAIKLITHFPTEFMNTAARQEIIAKHDAITRFRGLLANFFSFQSAVSFKDN